MTQIGSKDPVNLDGAEGDGSGNGLQSINNFFVRLVSHLLPDPYLWAIILTMVVIIAGAIIDSPKLGLFPIYWYDGFYGLLTFTLQGALIAITGFTLAHAAPVHRLLMRLAGLPKTQTQAVILVIEVTAVASLVSWGLGLVVAGVMSREVTKRVERINYPFIVAAAYSGFMVWASGFSSAIALATASPGNSLNIIQKVTGVVIPLSGTLLTSFNIVPVLLMMITLPLLFMAISPRRGFISETDRAKLISDDDALSAEPPRQYVPAEAIERSPIFTVLLVALGIAAMISLAVHNQFSFDFNMLITIFIILGLALHGRPIRYARSFMGSVKVAGPIILQYPLYGGLQGVMTKTGLATKISHFFVTFATSHTLPFFSFIASVFISMFVPSGGGHWIVQGPVMVPAAFHLHANQALVADCVAWGEQVANMIQPFWVLPILGIVGLGIRQVMGYTALAFFLGIIVFGGVALAFGLF